MLPREAVRVERTDGRTFGTFAEAVEHARGMRVGGDYTYAPFEVRGTGRRPLKTGRNAVYSAR